MYTIIIVYVISHITIAHNVPQIYIVYNIYVYNVYINLYQCIINCLF